MPPDGQYLWSWFWEFSQPRTYSDGYPEAMSWREMESWMRCIKRPVTPDEALILRQMDVVYVRAMKSEIAAIRERQREDHD